MKELEVYKITNKQNGKIYIGITNQGVTVRFGKHISDSSGKYTFPLHNAIRKYGKDNFQIEVIEIVDDVEVLKEREIYWIKYYDSYNRDKGYNLTLGGDGTFGRFHSNETKEKIRQKALGRKMSFETKQKMSKSQKKVDRNYSELAKKSNEKRWSNKENKLKASINNPKNKPVIKYTVNMIYVMEYKSLSEAERDLNIKYSHTNIASCARGKLKTAYGYIWKYKDTEKQ